MRRYLAPLVLPMAALSAHATTYTVNASQSTSTIQGVINGGSVGDTVAFSPGTYSITAGITLKCGLTYTAVTPATPSNVILSAGFPEESTDIFTLNGGCSNSTTISYLSSLHAGFIFVNTPNSNLTVTHNQIGDLKCCHSAAFSPAIFIQDPAQTNSNFMSAGNITYNQIGDSTSCTTPQNGMTLTSSPETYQGVCAGIVAFSSFNGLNIRYNSFFHVGEGVHIACYGGNGDEEVCSPQGQNGTSTIPPAGPLTQNVVAQYNDFNQIHRINWEEQPEAITGVVFQYNTSHDWFTPYYGSFGLSMACCANPASSSPYLKVLDNIVVFNSSPGTGRYGYGMESFGNQAQYDHNEVQSGTFSSAAAGMVWGLNCCSNLGWSFSYNQVQGGFNNKYIVSEFNNGVTPPTQTANLTGPTISAITSFAPTISPSGGSYSSPLTVTLTDAGYGSGATGPTGNTSIWYTTDGSTPTPGGMAVSGAQYFISPSGSDSNSGLSTSAAWLSPNHAVNCGDTITAVAGTYSAANFQNGHWGAVACSAGNNVAWLKCTTFDACKIAATGSDAMWVDKSYWGVQGWETTTSATNTGACFHAGPSSSTSIHHIIFANNVANRCQGGGFTAYDQNGSSTTSSVDYIAYVGNIAYAAAGGNGACYSGLNIYQPIATDSNAGTHMFVAGNFSWGNVDGNGAAGFTCGGVSGTTDGEGINFDTFDFTNNSGSPYTQQGVIENNIELLNGGRGIEVENNSAGSAHAPIYIRNNTMYGSGRDPNSAFPAGLAELGIISALNVNASNNLVYTGFQYTTGTNGFFALGMANGNGTDSVDNNYAAGLAGNNTYLQSSAGFSFGSGNVLGTNPAFVNSAAPGTPSCSGKANVPACMATLIANFTPTVSAAKAYGYQAPVSTPVTDALFPQWLCNVGLPSGLISTPCVAGNTTQLYTVPFTVSLPASVKAIGMWGAVNQPTSYPSGFGFVPSAVVTANYVGSGGVTLSSVSIAPTAGVNTLNLGSTVQMIVTCHYSDGSTSGCNTTDSHGNSVTNWASSNGNVTVSSTGLATGAAIGTAVITATVTGGFTTSPGSTLTVNASPLTLSSVSIATAGGASSINTGATNQLITSCHYSDGTVTACNTTDSHGNAASSYNSSAPSIATVTSGGLVTGVAAGSTNLTGSVIPSPSVLGTSLENVAGATGNGFINEIYGVTGTSAGTYVTGNCHITIPATTWAAGSLWTCLLVLGTPTTQNASALCSNSYTTTGTSWPGGDIVISMASCPALAPDQGYWVGSTTNQTQASPAQGFSNCNSSCSGAPPTSGSGTYAYRYVANTFGSYTNLPITLNASGSPGQQVSQYIELTTTSVTSGNLPLMVTTPPPSLVSAYLTASTSVLTVGQTLQMAAKCHYSSGPDQDCTVADIYGDAVSAWASSDPAKATIGAVGSANPGLVTAAAAGTPSITATIGAGTTSSAYPITVNSPAVTLTGVSLSTTGGVTALFVGATNQLKATCTYSDGSSDDCTTTDAHGNLAHNYLSTTPSHATVNATSGLVTAVAPGGTTFTAVAGSFTSNPLPLAVFPVLSGIYTITVSGSVKFSGTVRF